MKRLVSVFLGGCLLAGCATKRQVANLEGRGTTVAYNAPYEQVWRAAVDGMQVNDLEILSADRSSGYIAARRNVQVHTFGENVGLWVRRMGPGQTEVEVVSRQAGPPVAWLKNWENEVHRAISANLTREVPNATGAPSHRHEIESGTGAIQSDKEIVLPGQSTVAPELPKRSAAYLEQQRRVDALRAERQARLDELSTATDSARRDAIQRQLDQLGSDIRIEEQRLQELR